MRALVQRVGRASVTIEGEEVAAIGPGLLVLLGVTHDDDEADADRLADKVRALRVFPDAEGRRNERLGQRKGLWMMGPRAARPGASRENRFFTRPALARGGLTSPPPRGRRRGWSSSATSRSYRRRRGASRWTSRRPPTSPPRPPSATPTGSW